MKPVLYLDVDDTLLTFHRSAEPILKHGGLMAAPGAREFVRFALANFEVRWLTAWAPRGDIGERGAQRLGEALDMDPAVLRAIPGRPWMLAGNKLEGIDWQEWKAGRPFVWVEDDLLQEELAGLRDRGALHCYHRCNVTEDPMALVHVHMALHRYIAERVA